MFAIFHEIYKMPLAKPKNPSRHFWTECYFWEFKPDQKIKINLIEKLFYHE